MSLFSQIFTWWSGQTLGTRIWTARNGEKVGEDEQGNIFYRSTDGARRWVIYNGEIEASRVSPEWHGWLHHTYQSPPTEVPLARKKWEKPHKENLTGTVAAYHPPGSILSPATNVRADYEAWSPE
ncbi:NADH:ubiquinone oxidoreductase subunit NDUFA12 [Algicella marina]|uniref:NADH:ubiquinone oxidoreductase subunit NDUFA12 n=1 Tax=Algicella marina TaxID=2683284 RepID=A0A6P1SVH0_9RHOB|nr:NADH:ubiquinone oxidoreductase subunit NDUFA12 [Algicella marina]QHQ34684.1 NADH:ubiquinone oxidoreductase subunit NDUFA12 [Algicella marina]